MGVAERGVGGEPTEGGADLEAGRVEGSEEAVEAQEALAQRRIMCKAQTHAQESVWTYDFMTARTENGRPFRILNIIGGCRPSITLLLDL